MPNARSAFAFGMEIKFLFRSYSSDARNFMEKIARARIPRPCFDFAKFVNDTIDFVVRNTRVIWFSISKSTLRDKIYMHPDITINGRPVHNVLKRFILFSCEFWIDVHRNTIQYMIFTTYSPCTKITSVTTSICLVLI